MRTWAVIASLALSAGCATSTTAARDPPRARYALSSPDVGHNWHLHAKDGDLVCELPCEEWIAEHSGSYLVIHDEPRVWRVDIPSTLPTEPGGAVLMQPHIGKGSPALGTFGTAVALTGATTAFTGIAILAYNFFFVSCADDPCSAPGGLAVGAVLTGIGALVSVIGVYLMEHNQAAYARIVSTPSR